MKKSLSILLTCAMLLNTTNAFAYGCESDDVTAAKQMSSQFKQGVDMGAGMSPDQAGEQSYQQNEDDKGLMGLVMDCGMLFVSAGMGPSLPGRQYAKIPTHLYCSHY